MSLLVDSPSPFLEFSSNESVTDSNIKVLVCTANIGNEAPNFESMSEWIPNDGETKSVLENQQYPIWKNGETKLALDEKGNNGVHTAATNNDKFHIIAIGMQEATFALSEELTKSLTDGSSNAEPMENTNHHCHNGQDDTHFLHQMLGGILPTYTRAVSYQRGQMRLLIFYKKDEISLNVLSVKAQNTGKGGRDNKGGIVAECDIDSGTRISFLTAHLEAHEGLEKYKIRCSTLSDIFGGTTSELVANSCCDVSMTSHFTFAMGDLNFRTRLPNYEIGSKEHIEAAHTLAEKNDWDLLNNHDELMLALRNKECLVGFSTPRCGFPPTFKIERQDGYAYKSNRSPSYTDRILYKANHNLSEMIDVKAYGPTDHFTTSDHKPVRGAYEIQRNQRLRFRSILPTHDETCFGIVPSSSFGRNIVQLVANLQASPETLHFSVSSIECVIEQGGLSDASYTPSLLASFATTPNDAFDTAEDTGFSWNNLWRANGTMPPLTIAWPHTETIPDTLHARWDKEIRFKFQPYQKWGTPVDLTGAMLHVLIHDAKDDNLKPLGYCSLNLASIIIDSLHKKEEHGKSVPLGHVEEANDLSLRSNTKAIKEILMMNGKEIGNIKLNIGTWWLSA